ncbi:MAG: UpxY family transcription antiterminator [Bacteroidales bacterium]|jgi:transcription antitermination factor NusG
MLTLSKTYHWFALYTMSRQEKVVHSDLTEDGFESYLPLLRTKRKWSDRLKWIDEPMFRGYVFVRVSNKEYYKILQHRAVLKYIAFGGKPSVIPDHHMEALMRALSENLDFEITSDRFKPGQVVLVTAGPMCGCSGEILKYSGKKRLLVRIGDIGYSMMVEMPAGCLETVRL